MPCEKPYEPAELDCQLVGLIASGSSDALGRLHNRYARMVFALARRIIIRLEDSEEVVQDVFTQVWQEAARFQQARGNVAGWLVVMTRTRAIDRLRANRRRLDQHAIAFPGGVPSIASDGKDPEQATIVADDVARVREALRVLPAPQRTTVDLAYYRGFTHSEIAGHTGMPLGTVKTHLRAATAMLRSALAS